MENYNIKLIKYEYVVNGLGFTVTFLINGIYHTILFHSFNCKFAGIWKKSQDLDMSMAMYIEDEEAKILVPLISDYIKNHKDFKQLVMNAK